MPVDDRFYNLLKDIKSFVKEHILTERGSTYLAQAISLEEQACAYSNNCFFSCYDDEEVYELDYYLKLLQIIKARLKRVTLSESSCEFMLCTTYDFRSGTPVVVYETAYTGLMKILVFISMTIAGGIQFIRGQIDGELSAWSQVAFIAAAFVSIAYFYNTKQYSFIVPQVGSLVISSLQLAALSRHRQGDMFAEW
jgi:hypothetical protein